MIPKVIHYCWFGESSLPKLAKKCIKSWKKYCPDYEIIRWDESNYDIGAAPLYVRQAYEAKKWAFVTDYVRLQLVYNYGGIYLDTDVEIIKPIDSLLSHKAYFGFESDKYVATGLGFGAEQGAPILLDIMEDYENIPFILEDGTFDTTTCPIRNIRAFLKRGFIQNGQYQEIDGIALYPKEVFCPISYHNGRIAKTKQTISIHWFTASWRSQKYLSDREITRKKHRSYERRENFRYLPNRLLLIVLGQKRYRRIKSLLERK